MKKCKAGILLSLFYTKCDRSQRADLTFGFVTLAGSLSYLFQGNFVCDIIGALLKMKLLHHLLHLVFATRRASGFAPDCIQSGYFYSEHLWSSEEHFCEYEIECQAKTPWIIYSPQIIVLWKFPVLPVFSSHPYFQLSVIESWLNIVNCIVNRTILFAPRQITISHYRILIDHKSLIPSPPVIIKFIFNLIKGMYWIITVALIVSGLKTCFLKSWLVRRSCNSEFVIVKWGESCGHKWSGFQKLLSGCSVCGCTWKLVNLLLIGSQLDLSVPLFLC